MTNLRPTREQPKAEKLKSINNIDQTDKYLD